MARLGFQRRRTPCTPPAPACGSTSPSRRACLDCYHFFKHLTPSFQQELHTGRIINMAAEVLVCTYLFTWWLKCKTKGWSMIILVFFIQIKFALYNYTSSLKIKYMIIIIYSMLEVVVVQIGRFFWHFWQNHDIKSFVCGNSLGCG